MTTSFTSSTDGTRSSYSSHIDHQSADSNPRMLYCIAVNFLMSIFDNDLDFAFGFGAQRLVHITVII